MFYNKPFTFRIYLMLKLKIKPSDPRFALARSRFASIFLQIYSK